MPPLLPAAPPPIERDLTAAFNAMQNITRATGPIELLQALLMSLPAQPLVSTPMPSNCKLSALPLLSANASFPLPLRCSTGNSSKLRRRRLRRHRGLLNLLQAEAEGEGSDEGGTSTFDDLDIDNLGLNISAEFKLQVIGDQGKISGLHGCCNGLADNVRPSIPVRWYNVPYGSDSLFLLVDDMDFKLQGISFPLILSIIPDINYHAELAELRSTYYPPGGGYDTTGLWKGNADCSNVKDAASSEWCRAVNWYQFEPADNSAGFLPKSREQQVRISHHAWPQWGMNIPQVKDELYPPHYKIGLGPTGVDSISPRGVNGQILKRVPCSLRFKLYILDYSYRYPQYLPKTKGCQVTIEAGSPYDGRMREVFSRRINHGLWEHGNWGSEWIVDMTDFANKKTNVRITVEGSEYPDQPWWVNMYDMCVIGTPELVCDGTKTYDFAAELEQGGASTVVHANGVDVEPGADAEFANLWKHAATNYLHQGLFYQLDSNHFLGHPGIFTIPVFSYSGKKGKVQTTWSLLESTLGAAYQGPGENKGLGGARSIGAKGARAPCPIDGTKHRIRFRLYARKGSSTAVQHASVYVTDKTSGDDVHHELNMSPDTIAVAKQAARQPPSPGALSPAQAPRAKPSECTARHSSQCLYRPRSAAQLPLQIVETELDPESCSMNFGILYPDETKKGLVKRNHECKCRDTFLGDFDGVSECEAACKAVKDCHFFIFGHGRKQGKCYQEHTPSSTCPEGWEVDEYDFWRV